MVLSPRKWIHAVCISLVALSVACGGGGGGSKAGIQDYVANLQSSDGSIKGTVHTGSPPAATVTTASLRLASATGGTFIPGGTSSFAVSATATRVIIAVDGVDGYWELTGLTPSEVQTVLVTFAQTTHPTYTLQVGAGSATAVDGYTPFTITYTAVGTGDVQVNVTWDLDVDVDLHVLDPNGVEIFYGNDIPSTGGALDLDSNAGCGIIDGKDAENITWATGTAPAGTYKVLVDYYEACTTGPVHYVVTVNRTGHAAETFTGTFASEAVADSGGTCFQSTTSTSYDCGIFITSFTMP